LHQLPQVEDALGQAALALLRQLDVVWANAECLETATIEAFEKHSDAPIITSFPGLGSLTGARVLAEIGDDRTRFASAGALKAYAGSAPVTRTSGKSRVVICRKVKNQRLAAGGYVWAFASLRWSSGAKSHHDRRRATGDRHTVAQPNRLLGMLFFCLQHQVPYDEDAAFPNPPSATLLSPAA
jgi:transposase